MNRTVFFLAIINLFGISYSSFGQTDSKVEFDKQFSQEILKKHFDSLVDKSIYLLDTKSFKEISDKQNINIIMCLNTILMKELKNGRYEKLKLASEQKDYKKSLTKRYKWIPNRGMGFYFSKLKMELYGTPMPYAVFNIE